MYRLKLTVLIFKDTKAIPISYAVIACLIDYPQSICFISLSNETCEARKQSIIINIINLFMSSQENI